MRDEEDKMVDLTDGKEPWEPPEIRSLEVPSIKGGTVTTEHETFVGTHGSIGMLS